MKNQKRKAQLNQLSKDLSKQLDDLLTECQRSINHRAEMNAQESKAVVEELENEVKGNRIQEIVLIA